MGTKQGVFQSNCSVCSCVSLHYKRYNIEWCHPVSPHPQQRHGYQLRLAEIEQDKEELLRLKNAELSEMGMQLSSAQREGERVQAELKEQTGNVQSLRKKLDTALVRLLVECLWFGLQLWLELFWRVSECVFGNEKVKVNVYIGSFCVFITKNGQQFITCRVILLKYAF